MLIKNDILKELDRVRRRMAELEAKATDPKDKQFYQGKLLGAESVEYMALTAQEKVLAPLASQAEREESIQGFITRKKADLQLLDAEIEDVEMELAKMQARRAQIARFVEQLEQEVKP